MHKFVATQTVQTSIRKPHPLLTWKWALYDTVILTGIFIGALCHL